MAVHQHVTYDRPQQLVTAPHGDDVPVVYEPMHDRLDSPGLVARARAEDYNAEPSLTLSYAAGEIAPDLELVDDDQALRNDITVSRPGGSSARAVLESGPLSVQAPPAGVGRYDEQVELALYSDAQLSDAAGWLLHLGTVDESRYPTVRVDLRDDPHLIADVLALDIRHRIRLTDLPPFLPPGPVDLLVEGYVERIGLLTWDIEYTCVPASPWDVATADDPVFGRVGTDGAQLAADVGPDETMLLVTTTAGPLWTTDAGDFPFRIELGGEVATVVSVSGNSAPQTFTVSRATNGVRKAHAAGTEIRLARPAFVAW